MSDMVSIIMPAYNAERFIGQSIESVLAQTYENWELVIADDCSQDNTAQIVAAYAQKDSRVRYYKLPENGGAAMARNLAIEKAQGRYLAFLDSDDLWVSDKLALQIAYMQEKNISFCATVYGKIDENGKDLGRTVDKPGVRDYWGLLKNPPGNLTVIYDTKALGKIYVRNIRKRNDYVLWLSVIKQAGRLHCMEQLLAYHREREGSISSNKRSLLKYQWKVYREMERLNLVKSLYLMGYMCAKGVLRKLEK